MARVFITGMSGTGKSTLVQALAARGYRALDMDDDGFSEYRPALDEHGEPWREWVWREDRVAELLAAHAGGPLYVGGCASNQWRFYPLFDAIVLLSAPKAVLAQRLAERTSNPYGKRPEELAEVMRNLDQFEPLLRRRATLELDATAPIRDLVARLIEAGEGGERDAGTSLP